MVYVWQGAGRICQSVYVLVGMAYAVYDKGFSECLQRTEIFTEWFRVI